MSDPWEDYASTETGPWEDYKSTATLPTLDALQKEGSRQTRELAMPEPTGARDTDFLQALTQFPSDLQSNVVEPVEKVLGGSVSTIGNAPTQVLNAAKFITRRGAPSELPFQPGKSVLPDFLLNNKDAIKSTLMGEFRIPEQASEGLSKAGDKVVRSFTTPEMISTLPLFEFRAGRAAMAGVMAVQTPDMLKNTYQVLSSDAPPADKWESLGDAGINLAMLAGLSMHLTPEEVRAKVTPEKAAEHVESKPPPNAPAIPPEPVATPSPESIPPQNVPVAPAAPETPVPPTPAVTEAVAPIKEVAKPAAVPTEQAPVSPQTGEPFKSIVYRGVSAKTPNDAGIYSEGEHYTTSKDYADTYGDKRGGKTSKSEISLKNPFVATPSEMTSFRSSLSPKQVREKLQSLGHDGIIILHPDNVAASRAAGVPERLLPPAFGNEIIKFGKPTENVPVSATPIVDQPVKKGPGIVGMGGATPSEFERTGGNPTAMRYAKIDSERQQRGLEPLVKPDSVADQVVMDKAMAAIDHDRGLPERLIAELNDKPRPISDLESHVLLLEKIDLKDQYEKSARDAIQAYEDGRKEDMLEANLRTAQWSDKLTELEQASRVSGSERGRALRSLRVMANEDYSLASMEMQKRAAKGGAPLSPDERSELVKQHDELVRTNKAHEEYIAAQKDRISSLEASDALKQIQLDSAKKQIPKINPKILDTAKKIVDRLDKRADAARIRIKERLNRTSAGVDPTLLVDLAEVGASHLGHAALDFAEWSSKMVEDFGEKVRPYLKDAFTASQNLFGRETADNPLELARAMRERSPEEQIDFNQNKIEENLKAGKKDKINYYVQRIVRLFYQAGIKDRDALIDAVHTRMEKVMPGITRRQTMDAISGYGEFRPLSKDKITTELRGLKGEMQQLAKLEDMAKGEPPLKSGLERRTPTEAERQLIKKVEQAKFEFQIPMTDPSTQLKSALDTYKTSLRNRTADLEDRLKRGDFEKRPRRSLNLDNEALSSKAKYESIKQKFQESLERERLKKRPFPQQAQDAAVKWSRVSKLSSVTVFAKLAEAGLIRIISEPVSRVLGQPLKLIPGFASKSIGETGLSVRAEAKNIAAALSAGKEAWNKLKTGKSNIDVLGGKLNRDRDMLNFVGNAHGAVKEPVRQGAYARRIQLEVEDAIKHGIDPNEPAVQASIVSSAVADANRQIFMGDNPITKYLYTIPINALRKADFVGAKSLASTIEFLTPIVKVSTNIGIHSMRLNPAVGFTEAFARLATAAKRGELSKGALKLRPEDAGAISRAFKAGMLGTILAAYAWNNPDNFGGEYNEEEGEKKPGQPKFGAIRIFGVTLPSWMNHAPEINFLNTTASARRIYDRYYTTHYGDKANAGVNALAFSLMAPVKNLPFIDTYLRIYNEHQSMGQAAGTLVRDAIIPGASTSTLRLLDSKERSPKTFGQELEMGIPGLRQNVPEKQKTGQNNLRLKL